LAADHSDPQFSHQYNRSFLHEVPDLWQPVKRSLIFNDLTPLKYILSAQATTYWSAQQAHPIGADAYLTEADILEKN
jgi:hypothetical protein